MSADATAVREALVRVLDRAHGEPWVALMDALGISPTQDLSVRQVSELAADALLARAAATATPTPKMVEAGLAAQYGFTVEGAVYSTGERAVMQRILTAALATRTA